jgi:hypothetical protein
MERVPFNPTAIEFTECLAITRYEKFTERAVFNTAIALSHALMVKGKKLVSTERDTVEFKLLGPSDNLKYWRENKPPRKNADLNDLNFKRLQELKSHYYFANNAEALSFCLRTLRVYTDQHDVGIISKFVAEKSTSSYQKATGDLRRVRVYLADDLADILTERAQQEGKSMSLLINELLRECIG